MFGNFAAQAGVIASNLISSPNIIQPTLTWNFNDVIILDFSPPGLQNINDRPRINSWRGVNGDPDFSYLKYISGGKVMLSPSPTGMLIQPWGDRNTGSYKFSQTSIGGNKVAGIDLFTHSFATPINLSPSLSQWSINTSSEVTGEVQYQYVFKTGSKYPIVNIELDYKNNCKPVVIPNCDPSSQLLVFVGTGAVNGCPIFTCINRTSFTTFVENGEMYNDTDWINGAGKGLFGTWSFISGTGSFRNTSNSNQLGRQSIGTDAFLIVGNTGTILTGHVANFDLFKLLDSGSSLSFDVNYAWNAGSREIIFKGSNNSRQYRFFHGNVNNELRYFRSGVLNGSSGTGNILITGDAYLKAFNYKITNLGTGMEMIVRSTGISNPLYMDRVSGLNTNWSTFVTGISFIVNTQNILPIDRANYGIYFNNIKYDKIVDPISQLFVSDITFNSFRINWNEIYGATGYRLDVATDTNFTNYVIGYNNKSLTNTNDIVQNVNSGVNYYIRARSVNNIGVSANSPILNVKTAYDIINLVRNVPDITQMGDIMGCQKQEIFNYTNTSNSNLNYIIEGVVDDELIINNNIYESGIYPFAGWPQSVCGYVQPINGAHAITTYNGILTPNQSLKLEAMSYDNPGGPTLLRYDLKIYFTN